MASCEPYEGKPYYFGRMKHVEEHDFVAVELLLEHTTTRYPSTSRNNTPMPTVVDIAA